MFMIIIHAGLSEAGGLRGALAPQFLVEQLTLSQPGGQIMPTTVLRAPPDFQTVKLISSALQGI